jgi:hypothetical protein
LRAEFKSSEDEAKLLGNLNTLRERNLAEERLATAKRRGADDGNNRKPKGSKVK